MKFSFEQTLVEVWRQALIENADIVELGKQRYAVRRTPKQDSRQVDFVFDGNEFRGLEQNPDTKSRWAQMARSGKKVMQFLREDRLMRRGRWLIGAILRIRRSSHQAPPGHYIVL
jgi:hypothetical protein